MDTSFGGIPLSSVNNETEISLSLLPVRGGLVCAVRGEGPGALCCCICGPAAWVRAVPLSTRVTCGLLLQTLSATGQCQAPKSAETKLTRMHIFPFLKIEQQGTFPCCWCLFQISHKSGTGALQSYLQVLESSSLTEAHVTWPEAPTPHYGRLLLEFAFALSSWELLSQREKNILHCK